MWSITTQKIQHDPNKPREGDPTGIANFLSPEGTSQSFPARWFWSEDLKAWTRNVAKRTYYRTKKEAEAAVVLVASTYPEMLGEIVILAASDIAIENLMTPKRG